MTLAYTSCIRLVVLWYRASHTFRQYRFAFPLHKYGAMSRLGTARAIHAWKGSGHELRFGHCFVLSPCMLLGSTKRRFTVCVGTHTLNMFLKNFPTGRKNQVKGTISQMVTPLYHTRRVLSSQDIGKQHQTYHSPPCSGTRLTLR